MTSFIISTYDRPDMLQLVLLSLKVQTRQDFEVIVTDNQLNPEKHARNKKIVEDMGYTYVHAKQWECYSSSQEGVKIAQGEWLCFPSDDDYYVPTFLETMLYYADMDDLDLVYCNALFDVWQDKEYQVLDVQPKDCFIDKGGFLIKREFFHGFPAIRPESHSDGLLVEQAVSRGAKHGKVNQVLFVHN